MVWNPLFRQRLVLATLFMGLFSQFQMVFACELMDGKTQYVCCCDEAGNMSKGCAMGGGCQHQMPDSAMASGCCEVSYQQAPSAKATTPGSTGLQVLLLDAPQPPPMPASFDILEFALASGALRFTRFVPPRVAGTNTYLLTNRFRI